MHAYFEFLVQNRQVLEFGNYKQVTLRPLITFKEPLTEEIIALNNPDLSQDDDLREDIDKIARSVGAR